MTRIEALERLNEIRATLVDLGEEAEDLIGLFEGPYQSRGSAYGAFNFGFSGNPYDTTLTSIVMSLHEDEAILKD